MSSPAAVASAIPPEMGEAPWPDHEYVRGWGGHGSAVRLRPRAGAACLPAEWRYYAPACSYVGPARIGVEWTGPRTVRITMDEPALEWTVTAARSRLMGVLNPVSAALPLASWRPRALVRARERLAQALRMGRLQMTGTMPSGHTVLLMPQRMYLVDDSTAVLDGADLGSPTRLPDNPEIGGVPLPARGVLAIGQAMWPIRDRDEYDSARRDAWATYERSTR